MINFTNIMGLIAGGGTTIAFFPQAIKVWRSRSTKDISILTYIIFCSGLAAWIFYGVLLQAVPVIIANVITLALALSILIMKIKWK
jgi:MtN3 and saliva related transmembrane protein